MNTVTKFEAKTQQPQAGTVHWLNSCIERSQVGQVAELAILTPGLAGELLRRNPDNRGIRPAKSAQYANDIRAGRWDANGEPIIISREGLLNDGQHRANAVVEANKPIMVWFVFGVDRASRLTVDQGAARGAADYLGMEGVPNASVQASIARVVIAYERADGKNINDARHVSNSEVMARVKADKSIEVASSFAASHAKTSRPYAPPVVIGFCYYLFMDRSPLEAAAYMTQVVKGEGLKAKDPAYTVRDRLLNLGSKSRDKRMHVIIRGWNAYRQGRTLHTAVIAGDDSLPAII